MNVRIFASNKLGVCVYSQQAADPVESKAEAEVPAVKAAPVDPPVASVAPPKPEPAKKEEEDITKFREKVCNNYTLIVNYRIYIYIIPLFLGVFLEYFRVLKIFLWLCS